MELRIKDIIKVIEDIAPLGSQESYDNSGLIVGHPETIATGALLSFDCIEKTVDEAIKLGVNLIISHHPIVFKGLKRFNEKNYVERTVMKAIKNDIALYAAHTNLDNSKRGVNYENAKRIGITTPKILAPTSNTLRKLIFFSPPENVEEITHAIFKAGGGRIGDYEECSFEGEGMGAFKPSEKANPHIGEKGKREKVREKKIEILFPIHVERKVLSALFKAHPYEEVAHEVYPITNLNQDEGAGMIGDLEQPEETSAFLTRIKESFNCGIIRHTKIHKKTVQRIAFCGGSGSFLLQHAIRKKADIFITGDFKYHEFFDAEDQIIIADIGHFESEQFTPNLILALLKENFINFALHLSKVNTNPVKYF